MSDTGDSGDRVLEDLMAWIRQNGGDDQGWYIEEAPPEMSAPVLRAEPAAAAQVAPVAPSVQKTGDAAFDAMCERFVADTLGLIDNNSDIIETQTIPDTGTTDKTAALNELRARVLPCTSCQLSEGRTNTVFGAGNPDADVVFIGEAPGEEEDKQGEPFVGRSGQLLTKILEAIGYPRDEVFICNILKCRPPGNRDPLPEEVTACEPHLKAQLAILRPRVICCLGRVAAQTLLGTDASLTKLRGAVHFYAGIPVMATYHPAALLRNPDWKRDTWNDVRKLRALVDALRARES
jgi:uracil-DNA glycosylase family 4